MNPRIEAVLAPVGGWLIAHDWTLEAAFYLLLASIFGLLLLAAYGLLHLARHMWNAAATHWNNAIEIAEWAQTYGNDQTRRETP